MNVSIIINHFVENKEKDTMTQNREKDIRFHDRTDYDIKLAQDISDYHDFVGNSKEEGRRDI
jgi:hypothetical protein